MKFKAWDVKNNQMVTDALSLSGTVEILIHEDGVRLINKK